MYLTPVLNPDLSKPTCRVCLQNNHDENMSSIFDLDSDLNDLYVYEKIEQCAGIEVLRHSHMPTLICADCFGILKISYKFRTICRNSNEYLNEVAIGGISPKIEVTEQNPLSTSVIINNKEKSKRSKCNIKKEKSNQSSIIIKNENGVLPELFSEKYIDDNIYNDDIAEVWFSIEHNIDDDNISSNENIAVSIDKLDLDIKEEKKEESRRNLKPNKRRKKLNVKKKKPKNVPSKTLEISSDGAAIIREKKPRAKRAKKEYQPQICEICGNKYQRRYGLELHMRRHRDEKPYECEICSSAFHSNFELTRHMRKHTGSKPYKCSYCPRAFGDQSTLIKHERLHRNERPFKCGTCGKSFTYSNVLKHHLLTHTGEKPYTCELCGKCFTRPHHLRAHLETQQHINDPRSKILLQNIKKNNEGETLTVERVELKI